MWLGDPHPVHPAMYQKYTLSRVGLVFQLKFEGGDFFLLFLEKILCETQLEVNGREKKRLTPSELFEEKDETKHRCGKF